MAWGDAVIVAPESAGTNATKPVGTGPFRFAEWVQGDRVARRNPDYWGDPVALERATFKFISDPTAAFAAMMAGDVDAFPVSPRPKPRRSSRPIRVRGDRRLTEGETILAMNNAKPPLDDIRVREAMAHAIDRQAIIDGAMFGYGTPIGTHFAPHQSRLCRSDRLSAYDPDRARALLAEPASPSDLDAVAEAAAALLCAARRRDHRGAAARGRHQPRSPMSNGRNGWRRCSAARIST
jgi:peptide/nickel transport system substrate-binding protein